jgi:hypothetical protein
MSLIADGGGDGGDADLPIAVLQRDGPIGGLAARALLLTVFLDYFGTSVLHILKPHSRRVSDFACLCVECGGSGREIDRARDISAQSSPKSNDTESGKPWFNLCRA